MTSKSFLAALLFSLATIANLSAQCDCVTSGNCPVPINDNGIYNAFLDVTVNGPNDIAQSPLQQVCITLSHTWIGDLSVSLTSPSGVEYLIMADVGNNYGECGTQQDNAEVCIVLGTNKPLTNNVDYTCNTAPCSIGTCCLNGTWTVPCGGVTSPITGAIQAPNCNLNDFNIPGQPANGTWTLSVLDVCNMDVGNLENFSLTFGGGQACYACEADGGVLDSISITTCVGDDTLMLDLPPNYPNGPMFGADSVIYDYAYLIVQGNTVIAQQASPNLTGFPTGAYQVWGLSYLISHTGQVPSLVGMNINNILALLSSSTPPFCADLSDNYVPVTILPALPATSLTRTVCTGACVTIGTQQFCATGNYSVVLDSWHGCDSTVNLNLTVVPPITTNLVAEVCTGGCVTVGGQSYCAPTEQFINLLNWQGCDSTVHLTFNVHAPTATITPASPPAITCTTSSVALSAATSGPGTLTYSWAGPAGFAGSTQSGITATLPGNYTVTVSDNSVTPACTSTATVTVPNGVVPPDLVYNGTAPSMCEGQTFDLTTVAVQDQNSTGAILTIHSGTPATAGNLISNPIVSPTAPTTYYYKATRGTCTDEIAITLTVKPVPTATFTATEPSCITSGVTVTYTGNAAAGATYNWFFDGGIATPGTGAGPHTVIFPSAGSKAIQLTVTQNGCTSPIFVQNINVHSPLAQPVINCASTTSSITFSWAAVPNSTSYTVTSSVTGTQPTPTSYQVTGLTPGQQVTLTVVANGTTACGTSSATQTCTAQNCPPAMSVAITPVAKICRDANTVPFNLQATVTGGNGGGTYTYSGPGITNASLGTFNPSLANLGANIINLIYNENGCTAATSTTIDVFTTPTASLTAASPVCKNSAATVTFTGPNASSLNYTWDFGGGTATPGFGSGPQNVTWTSSGTKTVTVTVDDGSGCPSQPATATVVVEEPLATPVITCSPTTESVTFTWLPIANATGYVTNVTTGQVASQNTTTSYTVDGLSPGEQVGFSVTALGTNSCGNSMATSNCTAQNCPPVLLTIDPVADICFDATSLPVQIVVNIGGGTPSGSVEFVGQGVSASGLFDPNLAIIGANLITAIYTDGPCSTIKDITINVYATPTGDFTAPATVCQGSLATVSLLGTADPNSTYTWDFAGGTVIPGTGAGPHNVTWNTPGQKFVTLNVTSSQGCVSPIYAKMVIVSSPVAAPQPTCDSNNITTTSIEFTWPSVPDASGYTFTPTTGQTATQTGPTTWKVSGLQPLEQVCAIVTSEAGSTCPGATTQLCCNALPCPSITVGVAPLSDFCLGASSLVQLQVTLIGDNGTGTGTWSGPGVLNSGTGTFSPAAAGFGLHTITYTYIQDACTFSDAIMVGVYQQPSSDFSMDTAMCLSESATIQFEGAFSPTAIYTWDFDGGIATPGTGVGPHQVSWNTTGTKIVTLSVTNGSCSSALLAQTVQVDDQLLEPTIVCSATTDGVVFTWNTVPNATSYNAIGTGGLQTSDTSFVFTGLAPEEQVSIQVTVNGNSSCPLPVVTSECAATACPPLTVSIAPVSPICLTADSGTVQLSANVNGVGITTGNSVWSGLGVVNVTNGVFDPVVAGVGLHEITCLYQQSNCSFEDKIVIDVVAPPIADAGPDRLLTCWESDQIAQLGGSLTTSSNNISYLWTAASGPFPGDAQVRTPTVSVEGLFTLTVTNTALGCSDTDDVLVVSTKSEPQPEVEVEPLNCTQNGKDANMTVTNVANGIEPFLYSLNGEPFVLENTFGYLEAGDYELTVMDAEGCTGTTQFTVEETGTVDVDLTANIIGQAFVEYGQSISLTAISSLPESELDSIQWSNDSLLSCNNCLDPVATPLAQTVFIVTVFKGNCMASDSLTVFVDLGETGVYVPTAFSPNGDGVNDLFMIYSGPTVTRIKSFLVFDRWGEMVYEFKDFDPQDPARGWNGKLDGQPMNPAVFVWVAEVEFVDGSIQVLEGDVTLVR